MEKVIQLGDIQIAYGANIFPDASVGLQNVPITFDTPFGEPPVITLTWKDNPNAIPDYFSSLAVSLSPQAPTKNGFTAGAKRLKTGYAWYFNWIAIGKKA